MLTDYTAPFALWIVVRPVYLCDGFCVVEPAWAKGGGQGGLAVFVSRLHASIYATLRNTVRFPDVPGRTEKWRCIALHTFDLRSYMLNKDGRLNCAVSFGFTCDGAGALSCVNGVPRLRFIELMCEMPEAGQDVVFSFSRWVFAFMHDQWERLGAYGYAQSIDRMAVMDDRTFAGALAVAMQAVSVTHKAPEGDYWTMYDADAAHWISTPAQSLAGIWATPTIH